MVVIIIIIIIDVMRVNANVFLYYEHCRISHVYRMRWRTIRCAKCKYVADWIKYCI